jgi:peptidoglycan-associated lipoprotein
MKYRMLKICIPLALALAGGCATQSSNDQAATATSDSGSRTSSSSSTSGTRSDRVTGDTSGSRSSSAAAGQPGEHSVYFQFDNSSLTEKDRKLVEAHAQYLRQHPDLKVRVEGNADERGSKEYNLALGQRRAESVSKAMKLLGVKDDRVEAVSYGEEKPRAQGHDEQAWSQNRRSDIQY